MSLLAYVVDKIHRVTRLQAFMQRNGVKPAELARAARISRQHLLRLRKGIAEPTLPVMVRIAKACAALAGRTVTAAELFHGLA